MTTSRETVKLLDNKDNINDMGSINTIQAPISSTVDITDYLHFLYASMFFCMATFFQQSVSPITDVLQKELNVSLSGIGILSSAYFLTYLLCQLPFGILLQKYSHHGILLIVSIILTLCFILFGFINSLIFASILRIIGGAFGAPTWLITVTLVGDHFGNNEVQFFGAITTFFSFIITFIGITIQGYLYEIYGIWRTIYYILGLIGAVNVIAIIATMFIQHKKRQITSNMSMNKQSKNEMDINKDIDHGNKLRLAMSNYLNWCLGLYGFAQFTIFSSIYGLWMIPYLMIKFDFKRSKASFAAGIGTAFVGIGTLLFGYLASKHKKRKIYLIISDLLMLTLFYILYIDNKIYNEYIIFIVIIISALGVGSINILFSLVREYNASNKCEETATGLVNAIMVSSGLISQYVIGVLLDYHQWNIRHQYNRDKYNVQDFQFAFSCVIPTCIAIAIISTILLKETNAKNM